jgi:hypothetical protein
MSWDKESVERRLKALRDTLPPKELPADKGGYEIEVRLVAPGALFRKTLSFNGFIGMGDETLDVYKRIWDLLEEEKARRLNRILSMDPALKSDGIPK